MRNDEKSKLVNNFFYALGKLTSVSGAQNIRLACAESAILAQKEVLIQLFQIDDAGTVIGRFASNQMLCETYTPYGFDSIKSGKSSIAFCGQWRDAVTGGYPLGDGYRFYCPTSNRFMSADNESPFGKGGVNAYAYCSGDPINRVDPSGHFNVLKMLMPWRKTGLTAQLKMYDFSPAKPLLKGHGHMAQQSGTIDFFAVKHDDYERYSIVGYRLKYENNRYHINDRGYMGMPRGYYHTRSGIAIKASEIARASPKAIEAAKFNYGFLPKDLHGFTSEIYKRSFAHHPAPNPRHIDFPSGTFIPSDNPSLNVLKDAILSVALATIRA